MTGRPLTRTQGIVLGTAMLGMLAIGAAGARGTYSNLTAAYSGPTALGAVAAGEGATLILALAYVGLVMLGQGAPRAVRACLWLLPAVGSALGAVAAHGVRTTVVYAATPLAMVAAAEGVGLLARRIVVRVSGVDVEAERRAAGTVRRLAYEQARAERHPDDAVRKRAARRAWKLAARVGDGDLALGAQLVDVQRARLTESADTALAAMFAPAVTPGTVDRDAVTAPVPPALAAGPELDIEQAVEDEAVAPVPGDVTQATSPEPPAADLAELAVVAGVPTPAPGDQLAAEQLVVVLRWLRYQEDPPRSYRAAVTAFRDAGYVGSEERVRRAWGDLMSREEDGTAAR